MTDFHDKHLKVDLTLLKEISFLLDKGNFKYAHELASKRLHEIKDDKTKYAYMLKAELSGKLIDIGDEGQIEEAIKEGVQTIEINQSYFSTIVDKSSIEYNLGNAKSGLFRIQKTKPEFKFCPENTKLLTEAKNHYWKAYKHFQSTKQDISPQLFISLANALLSSGRIIEAIQYYDKVLADYPHFPEANASRSEALISLNYLMRTFTINLLWQAMQGFKKAAESDHVPIWLRQHWEKESEKLKTRLMQLDHKDEDVQHDLNETELEASWHSSFRKFFINNSLCLSEHSIYCSCAAARKDDLIIPMYKGYIGGDFVPRMELWLNRLKSEFSLARFLYYEAVQEQWEAYDKDVMFTELYENESIGLHSEMLRTAFRLCFGILDKIAHAICDLFDLSEPEENLVFESFWKPQGRPSRLTQKQQERWTKINSIENPSLTALYSQATDLNSHSGE